MQNDSSVAANALRRDWRQTGHQLVFDLSFCVFSRGALTAASPATCCRTLSCCMRPRGTTLATHFRDHLRILGVMWAALECSGDSGSLLGRRRKRSGWSCARVPCSRACRCCSAPTSSDIVASIGRRNQRRIVSSVCARLAEHLFRGLRSALECSVSFQLCANLAKGGSNFGQHGLRFG